MAENTRAVRTKTAESMYESLRTVTETHRHMEITKTVKKTAMQQVKSRVLRLYTAKGQLLLAPLVKCFWRVPCASAQFGCMYIRNEHQVVSAHTHKHFNLQRLNSVRLLC